MPQKKEERKPEKKDEVRPEEKKKDGTAVNPEESEDILDDIEDILETNAEEFVKNHRSKEGQ
jgi:ubiquitin-like protein Pup